MDGKSRKMIITGLMTALVFIMTFSIRVPVPYTSGYIHLGDSMIYISVILLGPLWGSFASGIGSMLSDILGGYAHFALPTLVIKSIMALCMGFVLTGRTKKSTFFSAFASIAVWTAFTIGAILNFKLQIAAMGPENVLRIIQEVDENAGMQTVNNLPAFLAVGIAVSVLILSAAALFVSRRSGRGIFGVKAIIGMTAAGMCMVMGYFIAETFMYGPIAATFTIPMNLIQFFGGVLAAGLLAPSISKALVNPVYSWHNE
jgi:uncharacterized membrane protein